MQSPLTLPPSKVRAHKIFTFPSSNNHYRRSFKLYILGERGQECFAVQYIPGKEGEIGMGSVPGGLGRE